MDWKICFLLYICFCLYSELISVSGGKSLPGLDLNRSLRNLLMSKILTVGMEWNNLFVKREKEMKQENGWFKGLEWNEEEK